MTASKMNPANAKNAKISKGVAKKANAKTPVEAAAEAKLAVEDLASTGPLGSAFNAQVVSESDGGQSGGGMGSTALILGGVALAGGIAVAAAGGSDNTDTNTVPIPTPTPPQPLPSYKVEASATSVDEGKSITFTITDANKVSGQKVTWSVNADRAADIDGPTSGEVTIDQTGKATVTIVVKADATTETAAETLTFTVGSQSASATINDTSKTPAQTFTLTTGVDKSGILKGSAGTTSTSGNDTFEAVPTTLTALDSLNGGEGDDVLNVVDVAGASASFAGTTVTNIETINITSTSGLSGGSLDTTGGNISGVKTVNVSLSAPGADQSITAGAEVVSLTTLAQAARSLTVAGGSDISVTSTDRTTGAITVGNTLQAPTGAVNVSTTGNYTDGADVTLGAISVTGGTTVVVTQSAGITAAEANAALIDGSNYTVTQGAVTVTGTASTTSVTVNQTAKQTKYNGQDTDPTNLYTYYGGQIGVVNGAVTINDVNRLSTTKSGTISEVTLNSFGAATINSGALATLNLRGTGTSVDASVSGALLTPTVTAMTINLNKASISGAVTLDADVTSVTINSSTTKSSIGTLAIPGATSLTVNGNAGVTISTLSGSNVTTVTNAGTSDLTISSTLGTAVLYTGGAGKDSINVGATTKAITTGAGDDTVVVSTAFGTGGSVDAGDGTDTLRGTQANLASLSASNTFETKISGFERLSVTSASGTATIDLANLDELNYVTVSASSNGATTFANATSGFVLNLQGTNNSNTVTLNNNGSADSITVNAADLLSDFGEDTNFGTLDVGGFELVTLNVSGTSAVTGKPLNHTMSVTDSSLKTLTVNGSAKLSLTHTGTALSNLDASTQTGGVSLTTGNLAGDDAGKVVLTGGAGDDTINAASANGTLLTSVTISGGAGKDTLTGSATKANTISGGAGNDTLTGGAKADTIDGGDGIDTFVFSSASLLEQDGSSTTDGVVINLSDAAIAQSTIYTATGKFVSASSPSVAAGTATYLYSGESSSNAVVVDTLTSIENATGSEGADYIVGSAGNNALIGGDGVDFISGGAGDDYLDGSAGSDVDTLVGGTGNDTYAVSEAASGDIFIESSTGGSDTIFFKGDYSLSGLKVGTSTAVSPTTNGALTNFEQIVLFSQSGDSQTAGASGADVTFLAAQVSGLSLLIGESVSKEAATTSITVDGSAASTAQTIDLSGWSFSTAGRTYTDATGATAIMQNLTSGTDLIRINGGSGVDTITGTSLADVITGGAGADVLTGGSGVDAYVVASNKGTGAATDSSTAAFDVIKGFGKTSASWTGSADNDTVAEFQATAVGGASADVLDINLSNVGGAAATLAVEADVASSVSTTGGSLAATVKTAISGAGDVTVAVSKGIMTLSSTTATDVDTLAEYLLAAAAISATDGETIGFQFDGNTYVFTQNGTADVLVQLEAVTSVAGLTLLANSGTLGGTGYVVIG